MGLDKLDSDILALKSFLNEGQDITQDELLEVLKSEGSDEEKSAKLDELIKSKTKKVEKADVEDDDENDENEEEEEVEKGGYKKDMKKSFESDLEIDFDEETQEYVDANPVLKSFEKSIKKVSKQIKSNDNKEFLKSIAQLQLGQVELLKSLVEDMKLIKSLPLALKGVSRPMTLADANGIIQKSQKQENVEEDKSLDFLKSRSEIESRLEKAVKNKDIPLEILSVEEGYRFDGTFLKSREGMQYLNILKKYES